MSRENELSALINFVVDWNEPNAVVIKETLDGCKIIVPVQLVGMNEEEIGFYLDNYLKHQYNFSFADPNLEN